MQACHGKVPLVFRSDDGILIVQSTYLFASFEQHCTAYMYRPHMTPGFSATAGLRYYSPHSCVFRGVQRTQEWRGHVYARGCPSRIGVRVLQAKWVVRNRAVHAKSPLAPYCNRTFWSTNGLDQKTVYSTVQYSTAQHSTGQYMTGQLIRARIIRGFSTYRTPLSAAGHVIALFFNYGGGFGGVVRRTIDLCTLPYRRTSTT